MKKQVLVTGITGFVGQHCAAALLDKGYAVKGTLRNIQKKEQVLQGLQAAGKDTTDLSFVQLDLLSENGWAKAMQGIDYVLHVASPYVVKEPKDPNELIKPAVDGTLLVLRTAHAAGVSKVVLTSSMVAMIGEAKGVKKLDQYSWTDEHSPKMSAYIKSKTMAERAAWAFVEALPEDQAMELAVVNPGPIYGPTLTGNLAGESMNTIASVIQGKLPVLPNTSINISDVRDVAAVHVLAMENPAAAGQRFITATEKSYPLVQIAEILKNNGYDKVSTRTAPNGLLRVMGLFDKNVKGMLPFVGNDFQGDISPAREILGWEPMDIQSTILDTAASVQAALKN